MTNILAGNFPALSANGNRKSNRKKSDEMLDKFGRGVDVKMKGVLLQWARLGSRRSSSASATCSRIDEHHCILPYCTQIKAPAPISSFT